jgi:hypothetical protein
MVYIFIKYIYLLIYLRLPSKRRKNLSILSTFCDLPVYDITYDFYILKKEAEPVFF